jgi:hypothetical protein
MPAQWRGLVELTQEIERRSNDADAMRRALDSASVLFAPMAPGSPRERSEPEWHALSRFIAALRRALAASSPETRPGASIYGPQRRIVPSC